MAMSAAKDSNPSISSTTTQSGAFTRAADSLSLPGQGWSRRGLIGAGAAALGGVALGGLSFGLAGCSSNSNGSSASSGGGSGSGPKLTLKMSQGQIADSPEGRAAVNVAKRVNQLTNGSITIHVFPNYTLTPSDPVAIQQLVTGALDIAVVSTWTNLVTDGRPFELPYAFTDLGDIRKAFAGPPGQSVQQSAVKLGVHLLNWWVITWRDIYGDKPIHNPGDLKGVKIRTQGTQALNSFYQAVGALPQTVASNETYLALQTKQVDLMESSYQFAQQQKHYEVAKYGSSDQHGISTLGLLVSNKTWGKMSASQQKAVQQAFDESVQPHDDDSTQSLKSIPDFLESKGMKINSVDLAPFQAIAKGLYSKLVSGASQQNVLGQIKAMGFAGGV
jgi:tripartite ATP-independent transporter DctP family solute receptor